MDVRTMTPDDEVAAIETVVLAFVADPVTRWVWPGAGQYLTAMPRFVRAFGGNAFARGGAYCSGEYSGAALWLPPGVHPNEDELERLMESTASPPAQEAGSAIFEQMATYHPREPHWYLPLIGVDPAHQSKGHGDALMRYADAPPRQRSSRFNGEHPGTAWASQQAGGRAAHIPVLSQMGGVVCEGLAASLQNKGARCWLRPTRCAAERCNGVG